MKEGFCSSAVGGEQAYPLQVGMDCCIEPHQTREPRGLSPSGGLNRPPNRELCQTGEPWHLSCHGGKTPANWLSHEQPRALRARCGVQGIIPCLDGEHGAEELDGGLEVGVGDGA